MKSLAPGLFGLWLSGAALLGLWAVLLLGSHFQSPRGTQLVLQARVQRALDGAGLDFAHADMRGQTALLTGSAPNALARMKAERVALTAAGPGGAWNGAVARVRSTLTLAYTDAPPLWRAVRDGHRLTLSGAVPSQAIADALAARARALFGQELKNEALVAPFTAPPGWESVALASLHQLARLDRGDARLVLGRLDFRGEGAVRAVAAAQRWRDEPPPQGMLLNVRVAEGGAEGSEGFWPSVKACQAAFDAAILAHPAAFDGQIEDSQRRAAIEDLSAIVRRCDHHHLAVSLAAASLEAANPRAEALARDLLLAGADGEHLRVNGLVNLARPNGAMVIVRAGSITNGEGET